MSFQKFIQDHIKSYETDQRVKVIKLGGGWAKERYSPFREANYDVERNPNSKLNPYKGWCEFTLLKNYTKLHAARVDAENDNEFTEKALVYHRHDYVYRNGEWVTIERKHRDDRSMKIGLKDWYDCNELISDGENKGETNLEGCWELW